jgi:predicted dehydrogenase
MKKKLSLLAGLLVGWLACFGQQSDDPLRIVVIGVSHGHVGEVTAAAARGEVKVVGIWEKDPAVRAANRLVQMYPGVVFDDLEQMLATVKPEAAMAYGSIYDHLSVVEACAPKGIDVMVEKPLAVSGEHARRMAELARRHGIHLLTNYETSWYPTVHRAREMIRRGDIGPVHRIEVYDGHRGPVEIGCGPEFLAWLTDPVLNGGGAVVDFGCYGANLATWLLDGERPVSVSAVLRQLKPEVYPRVDDDATILVEYPGCTVQIMGSWCWPMDRKDMHIYGLGGYIYQDNRSRMRFLRGGERGEETLERMLPAPGNNPFGYLTAVVRGKIEVAPEDLAALENNLTVVDILDAARRSARTGERVVF